MKDTVIGISIQKSEVLTKVITDYEIESNLIRFKVSKLPKGKHLVRFIKELSLVYYVAKSFNKSLVGFACVEC